MLVYVLLFTICCFLICRSTYYLIVTGKILRKGILTEGTVVKITERKWLGFSFKCAVFEFQTSSGRKIPGAFNKLFYLKKCKKGSRVNVIYDPSRPLNFFIENGFMDVLNFAFLSLAVSALLLLIYKMYT